MKPINIIRDNVFKIIEFKRGKEMSKAIYLIFILLLLNLGCVLAADTTEPLEGGILDGAKDFIGSLSWRIIFLIAGVGLLYYSFDFKKQRVKSYELLFFGIISLIITFFEYLRIYVFRFGGYILPSYPLTGFLLELLIIYLLLRLIKK